MFRQKIAAIVAADINGVIGKDNQLCWHIKEDLQRFKALTTGNVVVMGRKTFESLGKPLPNRINVILTRDSEYNVPEGCFKFSDIQEALNSFPQNNIFIIGGDSIYREAIQYVDYIYLTRVYIEVDGGDAFFPNELLKGFELEHIDTHTSGIDFAYYDFKRCQEN